MMKTLPGKTDYSSLAIVAINHSGADVGRRLTTAMPGSHLFVPEGLAETSNEIHYTLPLEIHMNRLFRQYRSLVLIMAAGIAVRQIAGLVKSKHTDPGIVVVDTRGDFAVSLLAGHLGGGNALAKQVADILGAQPVITTASDVTGALSADLLGAEFGWKMEHESSLNAVIATLVNGDKVGVYQDAGETGWWPEKVRLPPNVCICKSPDDLKDFKSAMIITDRIFDENVLTSLPQDYVIYRPQTLVVGLGCNRGTSAAQIRKAVLDILHNHNLSAGCIGGISTIDVKNDEAGITEFAASISAPVDFHSGENLKNTAVPSPPSPAALRHVHTGSVCEAAALLSCDGGEIIVPKTPFDRAVTVAIARKPFRDVKRKRSGKLALVGIGPGNIENMTPAARDAIKNSEVVAGYDAYLKLVSPILRGQKIIASGMREEVERARAALEAARAGSNVALICSGDSGIYGMAGLVGELVSEMADPPEVEVVPGVTSFVSCASLLGAPLNTDFASISLSDYLVPWEVIARRVDLAAQADFVIALYNPSSKTRRNNLEEAVQILLRTRSPHTPAGIVTNANRPTQQVTVTDLAHLLENDIGMNTTVIIGNSKSFVSKGWIVTPRGYRTKYDLKEPEKTK